MSTWHSTDNSGEEFEYDAYADQFTSRRERRQDRTRTRVRQRKLDQRDVAESIADLTIGEGELSLTYQPSLHEAGWLLQSLGPFFAQEFITDVLQLVKGGKEANVYCCAAHPNTGVDYLAAKVYRPHEFRTIRNDAAYREGRYALDTDGGEIVNDKRAFRALKKKSKFGRQLNRVSWLMYEFTFMEALYEAGAAVPKPWFNADNAILMTFYGDATVAAPTLSQVRLDADEVQPLFDKTLATIRHMLTLGYVHGDLSAYNILYDAGDIVVIDFPQIVEVGKNRNAARMLQRDIDRVCDYFRKQGLEVNSAQVADDLWREFRLSEATRSWE